MARKKKSGRPKAKKPLKWRIQVPVSAETYDLACAAADSAGMSLAEWGRKTLEQALRSPEGH